MNCFSVNKLKGGHVIMTHYSENINQSSQELSDSSIYSKNDNLMKIQTSRLKDNIVYEGEAPLPQGMIDEELISQLFPGTI